MKSVDINIQDNDVAELIIGPVNAHIPYIEKKLGVSIRENRPVFTISADTEALLNNAVDLFEYLEDAISKTLESRQGKKNPTGNLHVEGLVDFFISSGEATPSLSSIVCRKNSVFARSKTQADYIKAMQTHDLTFGIGPAGTGKTFMAVAYAASLLEQGVVERIILSRPAVEAGERLGFLPGDMKEKVDPYLRPLYDALHTMLYADRLEKWMNSGSIEIAPLAFMRGRTLANAAIILDEAQNCTTMQMKMFLTRLGDNSRMIITGDPSQTDLPPRETSGLDEATKILDGVDGISFIKFTAEDVVRHGLVSKIVKAYDKYHAKKD